VFAGVSSVAMLNEEDYLNKSKIRYIVFTTLVVGNAAHSSNEIPGVPSARVSITGNCLLQP
jgi:hypothetical protein